MNAKIILDELVRQKLLKSELAAQLTKDAEISKRSAEDIIHERQLIDDVQIAQLKAKLLGIPYKKLVAEDVSDELLKFIPEETVMSYKVVPIAKTKELLVAGMLNPDDEKAQEVLRFIAKQEKVNLGAYLISQSDFDLMLRKYNPYANEIRAALQFVKPTDGKGAQTYTRTVKLEEDTSASEEAPVIRIVASTLREAEVSSSS